MYTSMIFAVSGGGSNGIYKTTDAGASWSKVSDATIDALLSDNTSNLEFAHGAAGVVFAAVINNGNPDGFFRTTNAGSSWTQLETPVTNENGTDVGLNPRGIKGPGPDDGAAPEEIAGGQGNIHFSILADPVNPNIVYVGGDRQPRSNGDTGSFPNSIGGRTSRDGCFAVTLRSRWGASGSI